MFNPKSAPIYYVHDRHQFMGFHRRVKIDHEKNASSILDFLDNCIPKKTRHILCDALRINGPVPFADAQRQINITKKFTFETANGVKITTEAATEAEARENLTADLRLVSGG